MVLNVSPNGPAVRRRRYALVLIYRQKHEKTDRRSTGFQMKEASNPHPHAGRKVNIVNSVKQTPFLIFLRSSETAIWGYPENTYDANNVPKNRSS